MLVKMGKFPGKTEQPALGTRGLRGLRESEGSRLETETCRASAGALSHRVSSKCVPCMSWIPCRHLH